MPSRYICVIAGVPRAVGGLVPFLLLGGSKIGHMKAEGLCELWRVTPQPWHLWRHLLGTPGSLHLIIHMSWRKGGRLFGWPQVLNPDYGH